MYASTTGCNCVRVYSCINLSAVNKFISSKLQFKFWFKESSSKLSAVVGIHEARKPASVETVKRRCSSLALWLHTVINIFMSSPGAPHANRPVADSKGREKGIKTCVRLLWNPLLHIYPVWRRGRDVPFKTSQVGRRHIFNLQFRACSHRLKSRKLFVLRNTEDGGTINCLKKSPNRSQSQKNMAG